ncbi:MAG: alpha/beta fold hydrolase [Solirubrobacterales bacterium]
MIAPGSFVEVEGLRLHYTEVGEGDPVLLLHGWPTSAYLWRNLMPILGEQNRAIALDLPGFGHSDKPTDASYSFRFFDRVLEGFLDQLEIESTGLAVHDLGGPIGLYWASKHPERLSKIALLNTLVYARPSMAAIAFVLAARTPGIRSWLTSADGLRFAMRLGVSDKGGLSAQTIAAYQEPFGSDDARTALRKAAYGLHPSGFKELSGWLKTVEVPVRIVYGEEDRILPDVARTMRKVVADVPSPVELTALPGCGHFCQEDRPEQIARILSEFFRPPA